MLNLLDLSEKCRVNKTKWLPSNNTSSCSRWLDVTVQYANMISTPHRRFHGSSQKQYVDPARYRASLLFWDSRLLGF